MKEESQERVVYMKSDWLRFKRKLKESNWRQGVETISLSYLATKKS